MKAVMQTVSPPLGADLQARFSNFIESTMGIRMPPEKRTLLENRLGRRLRALGLPSYDAYWEYLRSPAGESDELRHFRDLVSTHKTEFFREVPHFETLERTILPDLLRRETSLRVWSCGCSTGEEPWSLAMAIQHHLQRSGSQAPFDILGTDVSEPAVNTARAAIYREDLAGAIPEEFRNSFLMRGTGTMEGMIRIHPGIRARVSFRVLNLMDGDYRLNRWFHLIFFRNVLIYFDKSTQQQVLARIAGHLAPGGYIVLGHAENMSGLAHELEQVNFTVFRKRSP